MVQPHAPSAARPWMNGRPPHIPFGPGILPKVCLLPGDPERVNLAAQVLSDFSILGNKREFRLGVGKFQDKKIAVCSTGIGGPSTEIAMVELFQLGVRTFIRVGGMGSLNRRIIPGSLTFVSSVIANSGTAKIYRSNNLALHAEADIVTEISHISLSQNVEIMPISVMSTDSYYLGQGRSIDLKSASNIEFLSKVVSEGVDAIDMESETVFALGKALNCKYGAILTAHGNRITNEWLENYEPAQLKMLSFAARLAASFA